MTDTAPTTGEASARLLSLGSINADIVMRVDATPGSAPTLAGHDVLRTSGGKAANVAVAARRLGAEVALIGCVGDDDLAALARHGPQAAGVDLDGVATIAGPTGTALVLVPPDGDKVIALALNANDAWPDDRLAVAAFDAAPPGSVLVADAEVPPEILRRTVAIAHERRFQIVLDPAPPDRVDDAVLAAVDHVTPDHHEARLLTGIDTGSIDGARAAARSLCERGPGAVYVKLAGGGCVVASDGDVVTITAPRDVDVVDTTGAGDGFAAGLGWRLLAGDDPPEAAITAVALATCAVETYGSQPAYPDRDTLAAMVARVRECNE